MSINITQIPTIDATKVKTHIGDIFRPKHDSNRVYKVMPDGRLYQVLYLGEMPATDSEGVTGCDELTKVEPDTSAKGEFQSNSAYCDAVLKMKHEDDEWVDAVHGMNEEPAPPYACPEAHDVALFFTAVASSYFQPESHGDFINQDRGGW